MGTGDYICVTLHGGAPWGFTLKEGEGDTYRPLLVSQVEEGGRASLVGIQESDELVSINGEPCADLTLLRAFALIDTSTDSLQLLLKRHIYISSEDGETDGTICSERTSSGKALESTTLHIISSKYRSSVPKELYTSESQGETLYEDLDINREAPWRTKQHSSDDLERHKLVFKKEDEEVRRCFSPGDLVELQVALSEQTLEDKGCTSLGSARGIQGEFLNKEDGEPIHTPTGSTKESLRQHGVVVGSPSMRRKVEVVLQQTEASAAGRGVLSVGGPRVSESVESQSEGRQFEGVPESFTISYEIPSEEADNQNSDSDGGQEKPSKHRAKHARLRRNESLSEKQVKEAKSKCKRIALLLSAAPPNPNNKGVLMFKRHRQRAKKFTLVSYGTGDDEPEFSDEEQEDSEEEKLEPAAGNYKFEASVDSKSDKHFLANVPSGKSVLILDLDQSLFGVKTDLNSKTKMECLPETKGKGALMFVQRRQRMDEITAEHEELRRQGIPVEGVQEAEKKADEYSYMQSTTDGHAYMDVNMHQQSQQHYQQYQEQQYYEQQQSYQQQQHQQYQQYQQQQIQQQQYEQQQQQQQQIYQQQQSYQEQQQIQHYSANINGMVQHQTNEIQSSFSNRTAKPFTADNMVATPYSQVASGTNQDSVGQGEQIASRDERISTPAIRTGLLSDTKRKSTSKPMFTFKEAPKVSPNPALLSLLNRGDRKGFESGPEEDYLSLGAEACNFLQSQRVKHKIPPPVAPKPAIKPNSPPWSLQIEAANQDMPQCAENSLSSPAAAPTKEAAPALEPEPNPAPAPESSILPSPQDTPANNTTADQHAWSLPEPESQQQSPQVMVQEANSLVNSALQSETSQMATWGAVQTQQQSTSCSWQSGQMQPQNPPPTQSPSQLPWVTHQPTQNQAPIQHPTNTWPPQSPQSWAQPEEQAQDRPNAQPPWAQPQEQPQPQPQIQPPWSHIKEKPQLQQMPPTWGQAQEPQPPPQNPWTPPAQMESQQQPPWVHQPQSKIQSQPPWVQQAQPETQPQSPWVQQQQHPDLPQSWSKAQAPGQPQPPWVSAQPQQQPSFNTWAPSPPQGQSQTPWINVQPQAQAPVNPINLNPWAPVPAQPQSEASWNPQPSEHGGQQHMNAWAPEQNQAQHQPPWIQPVPSQPVQQPNWQQPAPNTPQQMQMNMWSSGQVQPQVPANDWRPQSQQAPLNAPASTVNIHPSPKPWHPLQSTPQNQMPPPPPQRMHSFTVVQKSSSPVNPMATVLNPKPSLGSAYEMPVVKGKGADMFAKRQSRMEKFVVDSETVEANKASRSTSPAASLPNEWRYTPNVRAPPPRAYNPIQSPFYPPAATKQPPANSPAIKPKKKDQEKSAPAPKPLNVIDVMKHQPYKLDSSLFIFGPAAEAAKPPTPKPSCSPSNPPPDSQQIRYEQMIPVQQAGSFGVPYPQQAYGIPMQPLMHDGQYQQTQSHVYPYQQPPSGPYQQDYNQQYQQSVQPPYHLQMAQPLNLPYQQAIQAAYQPASSPPYLATPSVPYKPQSTSSYIAPNFPVATRPESASGGSTAAAPKPKFTANKSSAQVWKPTAAEKE
nr:synaptopodin-2 isoform X1 [Nothobranchius furzeri]